MTSQRKWTRFFLRAGIPQNNATVYATVFNANHLSLNILPQINQVTSTNLTKSLGRLRSFGLYDATLRLMILRCFAVTIML